MWILLLLISIYIPHLDLDLDKDLDQDKGLDQDLDQGPA